MNFTKDDPQDKHNFADQCIESEVWHRLLRFDFYCINIGNKDFVAGDPSTQLDIFFPDPVHEHYHVRDFNKYYLLSISGTKISFKKQAFCLEDYVHYLHSGRQVRQFRNCSKLQGISSGWADVYRAKLVNLSYLRYQESIVRYQMDLTF